MKEWWGRLNDREQTVMITGAIIIAIVLVYSYVWSPLTGTVIKQRQALLQKQQTLIFMQQAIIKLQAQPTTKSIKHYKIDANDLLTTIDTALTDNQLKSYVSQFKQPESGKAIVNFDAVPFDDVYQWLTKLWQQYQIKVLQLNLTPLAKPGLVKLQVTLGLQARG